MDPSASTYHSLLPFPSGGVPRDQNAELIALWCLRILVHLRGQKDLLGRTGCLNDHILDAIGLGHLNEEQIVPPAASKLLPRRLAELEGQAPRLTGPLADNLRHAAEVLGLSASDQLVLAFAALIDRWQPRLVAVASRMVGDRHAVLDIVQETWMAVVKGLGRLDDVEAFAKWIFRILNHKSNDWLRRRGRQGRGHRGPGGDQRRRPETRPGPGSAP